MAAVVDEATGVIRTTSVLQEPEQQGRPSTGPVSTVCQTMGGADQLMCVHSTFPSARTQVRLLWTHYKSAKGTLERLAADASEGRLDVHSPYVERAVCLLEVLVLRKEKGPHHFMNLTLGAPVIPNNPEFDPSGDGKRRSELPPTVCVCVCMRVGRACVYAGGAEACQSHDVQLPMPLPASFLVAAPRRALLNRPTQQRKQTNNHTNRTTCPSCCGAC